MILAPRDLHIARLHSRDFIANADVVVGVGLHNQAKSIGRCLSSIFEQNTCGRKVAVVILDDRSSDDWEMHLGDLLDRPEVVVIEGNCGSPARTRNAILDFVDEHFARARWIARLDADDRFSCIDSLAAMCAEGEDKQAQFVLGGNRLMLGGELIDKTNPSSMSLLNEQHVLCILEEMARGTAINELPSCNLLLATRCGWRYPDIRSAEDHWLVADLLLNHLQDGAILTSPPYYCDYTLDGVVSKHNVISSRHSLVRRKLYEATSTWRHVKSLGGELLGHGQEGAVCLIDGHIEKHFYPGFTSSKATESLNRLQSISSPHLPRVEWNMLNERLVCRYPQESTDAADTITVDQAREFLFFCLENGIVCKNIKRDNFRITSDGKLLMIDIGQDVVPMHVDFLRDSAARLYALAALGSRDGEYLRRDDDRKQEDVLAVIPGFDDFYHDLIRRHAKDLWSRVTCSDPIVLPAADDVSLLIKCCAMDAAYLEHQVRYIVNLLSKPRPFKKVILVIDPYTGPFLRQHSHGDMGDLMREAHKLQDEDTVDRLLVAPVDDETMRAINGKWFNIDSAALRTANRAPVVSQLWGFEQVRTRYALQCDVDVLIGRRDIEHDYLTEMVQACESHEDVLGVAFNIPHPDGTINPYAAAPGEYVPEVRCGLLDLHRIRECCPIPNSEVNRSLELTWHRSLQQYQKLHGMRTLRGGDARTFYIHPENHWKGELQRLAIIRDLVAQGRVPYCQMRQWDLQGEQGDWVYPPRSEDIVFLLKGRNTSRAKLKRCFASLKMQDDQDFGLVVIDDASQKTDTALLQHFLKPYAPRSTLIRRHENQGRIPNFMTAIKEICVKPETLVVILDLDDALIHPRTVSMLREKWIAGHDVIIGGMFRPDKPLKLYHPSFSDVRANWGADVWTHLRAFRKRLFDLIHNEYLQIDGEWIQECTDYATMMPIVELAAAPVYIPQYLYWHERTTCRDDEVRNRQEWLLKEIMMMKPLTQQQV